MFLKHNTHKKKNIMETYNLLWKLLLEMFRYIQFTNILVIRIRFVIPFVLP